MSFVFRSELNFNYDGSCYRNERKYFVEEDGKKLGTIRCHSFVRYLLLLSFTRHATYPGGCLEYRLLSKAISTEGPISPLDFR